MLSTFKRYLQNLPGKRTNRKLVVIESDDWGSIRMPNKDTFKYLQNIGAKPEKDPYLRYDSLASESDLEALFEVLISVKDSHGNYAKLTANCVMANPNFDKIKKDNFETYHYQHFQDTLKSYPQHQNAFNLWKEGIKENVFRPQCHGREHLNVHQWMKGLRDNDYWLHKAFDNEMISVSSMPSKMKFGYMEGLDYFSDEERLLKRAIIKAGLDMFEATFGFKSKSFIANCYIWDESAEEELHNQGVKYLQGIMSQIIPQINVEKTHSHRYKKHYFGQKNKFNQRYLVRNVFFEPSLYPNVNYIDECLKRIEIAFRSKKPAIIGSHRLNYIGFIDEKNRTKNLQLLKNLLSQILKKWPDVEFVSTDELDTIF